MAPVGKKLEEETGNLNVAFAETNIPEFLIEAIDVSQQIIDLVCQVKILLLSRSSRKGESVHLLEKCAVLAMPFSKQSHYFETKTANRFRNKTSHSAKAVP